MKCIVNRTTRYQVSIIFYNCTSVLNINCSCIGICCQMLAEIDVDSIAIYRDPCTSFRRNLLIVEIDAVPCCIGYIRDLSIDLVIHLLDRDSIRIACAGSQSRDLAAIDIDSAITATERNPSASRYIFASTVLRRGLVADGRDALQIFCQLDFQLTLIRAVDTDVAFCQGLAVRTADDFHGVVELLGNFLTIIALELQALACQILCQTGLQRFQLCDVDGIGVVCASSYAVELAGYCAISGTNGYSAGSCIPDMGSLICRLSLRGRIIATYFFSRSCYCRAAADGYAALSADFCVVADGYDIGGCRFIVSGIGRTDDDVVLPVRQFVVITEDDVGLVRIYAVTADLVLRADDIVVLAVGQLILEAVDEVVLRRCSFCVGAVVTGYLVADTGDLGHVGFVNGVAAAHDHDLSTAGWYSLLQILSHSCRIFLSDILLNLAQVELRGINRTVRIGDRIACTIDDGGIRVSRRIGLADNAVGHTAEYSRLIRTLVHIKCTIR